MVDINTCDRIIVESNDKMESVIQWYMANCHWIDKNEFNAPFQSGLVVLQEEDIQFTFETKSVDCVEIGLYMSWNFVGYFDYNPTYKPIAKGYGKIKFSNSIDAVAKMRMDILLEYDNTLHKESLKYHALMVFAAYYREQVVLKSRQKVASSSPRSRKAKNHKLNLVKRTYVIEGDIEPKKDKHKYSKPTHEVSVNGHYRHYKSGKVVWVNSYKKYKGKGNKVPKEYKL